MKQVLLAAAFIAVFSSGSMAHAQKARPVALSKLASYPAEYEGKRVRLARIPCVDDPDGAFTCAVRAGGQMLLVSGNMLGVETPSKTMHRLATDCRGTANLANADCVFDIEITPRRARREVRDTPEGSLPFTLVNSAEIDLFPPRK